MRDFKLLILIIALFGLVYFVACDSIPLTSANNDEKNELKAKVQVLREAPEKSESVKTSGSTSLTSSSSFCGGLKGFLHLCQDNEKKDNSKQKRSLTEEEDIKGTTDSGNKLEERKEIEKEEKRNILVEIMPTDDIKLKKVMKRQVDGEENGEFTSVSEPKKLEESIFSSTPVVNLNQSPVPLSSDFVLPLPQKRQENKSEAKEKDDDDNDDDDSDGDNSNENDETDEH